MIPNKKSPALPDGASETDSKVLDNVILPDQVKTVNSSEASLKTIFDVLLDNTKKINHGTVSLELHVRDNRPWRFEISRNESFIIGKGE